MSKIWFSILQCKVDLVYKVQYFRRLMIDFQLCLSGYLKILKNTECRTKSRPLFKSGSWMLSTLVKIVQNIISM